MADGDVIIIFGGDVFVSFFFFILFCFHHYFSFLYGKLTFSLLPLFFSRYVAMHTMQETSTTTAMSRRDSSYANGYAAEGRENSQRAAQKSMRDVVATVVGMILPLFLQIGHAH